MRFNEIGQQLRAFRLESGLRAEEVAARLGVSRAALYRYEKGEVIKLDTVKRLAELLKISPLSLLGIGIEYYTRAAAFLERLRQLEETADQVLQLEGPFCYLTTSDSYDAAMREVFEAAAERASAPSGAGFRAAAEQAMGILAQRKRAYAQRKPNVIALLFTTAIERFLAAGIAGGVSLPERLRRHCRDIAMTEVEHIISLMEAEPMGVQFGVLNGPEPSGSFSILRTRERTALSLNPFRMDTHPADQTGVAMITHSDEAVGAHQRIAEALWQEALKGPAGAARLRELVEAAR
ncbi:MAG TPA: helix-turn-helix transcriptional regulator [Acetobacteraceae bacterium]|nr:helix-turn-helix transcriptional regulator [Acetobacteraceae bacterium]